VGPWAIPDAPTKKRLSPSAKADTSAIGIIRPPPRRGSENDRYDRAPGSR
jgi:hypothetical protein